MNRILFTIAWLGIFHVGYGQSTNVSTLFKSTVNKADHFFDHLAYRNALHLYLHVAEKDPKNQHARVRVAECYLRLADPQHADVWLSTLVTEPEVKPETIYLYVEALAMNHRYADAKTWMETYQKLRPDDTRAKEKIAFFDFLNRYNNDSIRFAVSNVPFNSEESDFGLSYHKHGFVFSSSRPHKALIHHNPANANKAHETLLNLYYVELQELGDYGQPELYQTSSFFTKFHDGPLVFYDDYKKVVFTRSNLKGNRALKDESGKVHLQLFFADVHEGRLDNIQPFAFNGDHYSTSHPTLSKDGRLLFFASTMSPGIGGTDLYYSKFENGAWQKPINAGPTVNTPGDELFPYLSNDTTLFFSSNGHGSLGGLDILVSHIRKDFNFTKVRNFMAPLNSTYDDFAIVMDSTERMGYLSSNRPGGHGLDDIYVFISSLYSLRGEVRELSTEQQRLPGTKISVYDKKGTFVDSVRTDQNGNFFLTLPYDQDFKIRGEKDGFETLEDLEISTRDKTIVIDSILLPLWRYKLFAKGKIYNNETQNLLAGATVTLRNLSNNTVDSVVVDSTGEYNFLIRPHRKYEIMAHKPGFIPVGFQLDSKDLFEGDLLNDLVLEEVYIEKEEVYFDYAKSTISAESMSKMIKVVRTLKRNPKTTLHIGAHADSRGTNEVNQRISQQRANATMNYFVNQGIAKSRIEAVGFGEELILNRCSDGVICPEEEHSKNRRAELKVQGLTRIKE